MNAIQLRSAAGIILVITLFVLVSGCTLNTHISSENGKTTVSNETVITGCLQGHTNCSYSCVDLQSDDFNCGSCGTICSGIGESCRQGTCACDRDHTKCGDDCVNLKTDNDNCGQCGNFCAADESCSGGVCSDR